MYKIVFNSKSQNVDLKFNGTIIKKFNCVSAAWEYVKKENEALRAVKAAQDYLFSNLNR